MNTPQIKPAVLLGEVLLAYLQQDYPTSEQLQQSRVELTAILQEAVNDIFAVTGTYPGIGDRIELGVAGRAQRFYFVRARNLRMRSGAMTGFDILIDT